MEDKLQEGEGLSLQRGMPRTLEELQQAIEEIGLKPIPGSPFGFRPVERSLSVPSGEAGASVVGAARGLRARRRGEIALSDGVQSPKAKELLAKSEASRDHSNQEHK
jgi:hypothetical protein